jgi:hypothetical protein
MLITYFKDPRILARYRSRLASIYLEDFITWLESQGYRRFMIRRHVRGVVHFTDWAEAEGLSIGDLNRGALNRLCSQLEERKSLRYPSGNRRSESERRSCTSQLPEAISGCSARPPSSGLRWHPLKISALTGLRF